MDNYAPYCIKSFKHDGQLHRMWMENWFVPERRLIAEHRGMHVLINDQTKIVEADGKQWTSKIPGISFFIPNEWHNIVALLEPTGIRYYCNVASPPYVSAGVLTYIDYDLDAVVMPDGQVHILDEDEYERHKQAYQYSSIVDGKVQQGLDRLLNRIKLRQAPFQDEAVLGYYEAWKDAR